MSRSRRWARVILFGAPLLAVGACFSDDVVLRAVSDDIQFLILGVVQTVVATVFDQLLGVAPTTG